MTTLEALDKSKNAVGAVRQALRLFDVDLVDNVGLGECRLIVDGIDHVAVLRGRDRQRDAGCLVAGDR